MGVYEPVVLAGHKVTLRLIGPRAAVWPTSPAADTSLLSRSDMVARPLPLSQLPDSPDLASASYTLRLDDAGEMQLVFPNTLSSDGVQWRDRFDPSGHLMFIEVYLGGELEQVVCIDTVSPSDGAGFSSTLDATDFASSLQGNGAGLQNGSAGQLQAVVFDPVTLGKSLFDVGGWQDFSDASFTSLLQALLNAALGLRLTPWQVLSTGGGGGGDGSVTVHGQDGWFLLKKAYERDWTVVLAPRDVIERGTQVWAPVIVDNFPAGALNAQWTASTSGGGTVAISPAGGLSLSVPGSATAQIASAAIAVPSTGVWRSSISAAQVTGTDDLSLQISESNGDTYELTFWPIGLGTFTINATTVAEVRLPAAVSVGLLLESDGEWVWAFANGQLVGAFRRGHAVTASLATGITLQAGPGSASVTSVLTEALEPFLMRGADKGDYVLPGVASTFPNGGIAARYYHDTDLQADSNRLQKILSPDRSVAYGASTPQEYADQQDPVINGQTNPGGAASSNWSAKYFGAIWLKLSAGSYGLQIDTPSGGNSALRVWVGATRLGDQLVDEWTWQPGPSFFPFTVAASTASPPGPSNLVGSLPYDGGLVARDGWYPIKIEYAVDSAPLTAPALYITFSPAAYTDPGGTSIAAGAQTTVIPATSLSPLGCVDQRYQGVSHFDLVQQTLQAYGYHASVEPEQLESGQFPGVLAPRVREGHDTDLILTPDTEPRGDWTGPLRPQLANTWPLPGPLRPMRWRPGDGLLVQDRQISVWDTEPRQILTFVRNLVANGITSAVASLANRPRNPAHTLKQQLYTATRWQRNYQGQRVMLNGGYVSGSVAAGATGASSTVALLAGDRIVSAELRVTVNSGGVSFDVVVNGSDVTGSLNGPWSTVPANIGIGAVARAGTGNSLSAAILNTSGATASDLEYQLLLTVLR